MSDKNLRAGLIRLAHAKPELRAQILPLLAQPKGKQAGQTKLALDAGDLVEDLVGGHSLYREALMGIYKSDPETADILRKAFAKLADMMSLSSGGSEALSRLRQVVMNYGKPSWDEALIRNNVFKAAVSLGIPTGSLKFANGMAKEATGSVVQRPARQASATFEVRDAAYGGLKKRMLEAQGDLNALVGKINAFVKGHNFALEYPESYLTFDKIGLGGTVLKGNLTFVDTSAVGLQRTPRQGENHLFLLLGLRAQYENGKWVIDDFS